MENCTAASYFSLLVSYNNITNTTSFTDQVIYCWGIGQGFNWTANCDVAFSSYDQNQLWQNS